MRMHYYFSPHGRDVTIGLNHKTADVDAITCPECQAVVVQEALEEGATTPFRRMARTLSQASAAAADKIAANVLKGKP